MARQEQSAAHMDTLFRRFLRSREGRRDTKSEIITGELNTAEGIILLSSFLFISTSPPLSQPRSADPLCLASYSPRFLRKCFALALKVVTFVFLSNACLMRYLELLNSAHSEVPEALKGTVSSTQGSVDSESFPSPEGQLLEILRLKKERDMYKQKIEGKGDSKSGVYTMERAMSKRCLDIAVAETVLELLDASAGTALFRDMSPLSDLGEKDEGGSPTTTYPLVFLTRKTNGLVPADVDHSRGLKDHGNGEGMAIVENQGQLVDFMQ